MPAYVGGAERLIAPVGLRPLSELAQAGFARDVRELRTGGAVLRPGETWLRSPGRSPEAAFSLFQYWDQISGDAAFKTAETGLSVVGEVAADLLPITQQINRRFSLLAEEFVASGSQVALDVRDHFVRQLRDDVLNSARALTIPMTQTKVSIAAGEAVDALERVYVPRSQDRLLTPVSLRRELKAVNTGVTPFVRVTQDMAVTLKRVTDAVDRVDKYVAVLPFAAAAMDLLAATNEDEARLALKRAGDAADDLMVSTVTSGVIGALATIAITLTPFAWGFYGIAAIRLGAGAIGFYLEPVAQRHFKEQRRLLLETKPPS